MRDFVLIFAVFAALFSDALAQNSMNFCRPIRHREDPVDCKWYYTDYACADGIRKWKITLNKPCPYASSYVDGKCSRDFPPWNRKNCVNFVDEWNPWSQWSPCSKTCEQTRTRSHKTRKIIETGNTACLHQPNCQGKRVFKKCDTLFGPR